MALLSPLCLPFTPPFDFFLPGGAALHISESPQLGGQFLVSLVRMAPVATNEAPKTTTSGLKTSAQPINPFYSPSNDNDVDSKYEFARYKVLSQPDIPLHYSD